MSRVDAPDKGRRDRECLATGFSLAWEQQEQKTYQKAPTATLTRINNDNATGRNRWRCRPVCILLADAEVEGDGSRGGVGSVSDGAHTTDGTGLPRTSKPNRAPYRTAWEQRLTRPYCRKTVIR
jgi:hypothetical protein